MGNVGFLAALLALHFGPTKESPVVSQVILEVFVGSVHYEVVYLSPVSSQAD